VAVRVDSLMVDGYGGWHALNEEMAREKKNVSLDQFLGVLPYPAY
jgi:hypothetical protein